MVVALIVISSRVSILSGDGASRVIAALASELDGEVELDELQLRVLPRLRAEGRGLRIRHKGRRDVPPLISIAHFSAEGSFLGFFRRHVSLLTVDGLDIEIPRIATRVPARRTATGTGTNPGVLRPNRRPRIARRIVNAVGHGPSSSTK